MDPKFGIDFGGVICSSGNSNNNNEDTMFSENYLNTPKIEGSFEIITNLIKKYGSAHVFIISKAYPNMQRKTINWLKHNKFPEITGFDMNNVHFCLRRDEKGGLCSRLKITHFIDDKIECLNSLPNSVNFAFLFPSTMKSNQKRYRKIIELNNVNPWKDFGRRIGLDNNEVTFSDKDFPPL